LREAFNSPDRFGKGLDWTGYTVHDAANILRRYFNQLPEPIIPLEFYERFRDPLRNHQSQAVGEMDLQSPSVGDFDPVATIRIYQSLITELPPLNRQLLLYILDLLAVFASKSDLNKMTTPNLAAIFQPGILSHPSHDMAPPQYRLSQDVLIFLIENQDHFLIGMQGTAADEKTVQEVESGPPTPAVIRPSKSVVGRSSSNASKYSGVRRSVSVSSKQSRNSVSHSPMTPNYHGSNSPLGTPASSGGVHRSNTVPSNRSPMSAHGGRFQRENPPQSHSPTLTPFETGETPMFTPAEMPGAYPFSSPTPRAEIGQPQYPAPPEVIAPSPEATPSIISSPVAPESSTQQASDTSPQPASSRSAIPEVIAMPTPQTPSGPPGQEGSPSGSGIPRTFTALFAKSPPTDKTREGERKPNKLQKRKGQGGLPSANSSTNSLGGVSASGFAEDASIAPSTGSGAPLLASSPIQHQYTPTQQHTFLHPSSTESTPIKPQPQQREIGTTNLVLPNPPMSPTHSYKSHSEFTEGELDNVEPLDHQSFAANLSSSEATEYADKERKRKFWPPGRKKGESMSYGAGQYNVEEAQRSRSSVLSSGEKDQPRKSSTLERGTAMSVTSDDEKDRERKNHPLNWIERKLAERQEKKEEKERLRDEAREEKKRAKSPTPMDRGGTVGESMQSLSAVSATGSHAIGGGTMTLQAMGPAPSQSSPSLDATMIPPRDKSKEFRRDGSGQHAQNTDTTSTKPPSSAVGPTSHPAPQAGSSTSHAVPQAALTASPSTSGGEQIANRPRDIVVKQPAHTASPLGSPTSIARSSMDASTRERERQRSLLDIGEDALEKVRSRD
jgi:hypothetical protein